ncbi:hypothetical protein ACLI1A_17285 [Flavobacterium sp. RHBU_3]|uniref:hypothetical protein n=1 Tax=Flavobacterium sp. RHBU_3 TaxID=3391184 RepID=UPI0039849887
MLISTKSTNNNNRSAPLKVTAPEKDVTVKKDASSNITTEIKRLKTFTAVIF